MSCEGPVVRKARAADVPVLHDLETRVFATDRLSLRSLRRLVARPSAAVLVAECDGVAVGYALVLYRRDSRTARLYGLARDPAAAPPGTGARLLAAAEAEARARGCTGMHLEVRADNTTALRLYEREGYRKTGSRPHYYQDGAGAVLMRKPL